MTIFISTNEACEILNHEINPIALQAWVRQGNCPLGVYVKKEGKMRGSYHFYRDVVEEAAKKGFRDLLYEKQINDSTIRNRYGISD